MDVELAFDVELVGLVVCAASGLLALLAAIIERVDATMPSDASARINPI